MWKYVSRRVKDTIELGINARKAFSLNQINHEESQQRKQQQQSDEKCYKVVPRLQDPSSRDQHNKRDEKFKRKYQRLTLNQRQFLSILTWSAALVSGFYTSQLLCLYRRNHRYAVDGSRCFYSKYLINTTQSVHQNIKYLLTHDGQRSLLDNVTKFATTCPFHDASADSPRKYPAQVSTSRYGQQSTTSKQQAVEKEFKDFQFLIDPEYHRYARFFETPTSSAHRTQQQQQQKPQNIGNEIVEPAPRTTSEYKEQSNQTNLNKQKSQDEVIDETVQQLADIVGELEFQLGCECYRAEQFEAAVEHFRLSSNYKHAGGIFNLATCYEKGLGVRKNLKTAKQLYEIASQLGHAKAMFNMGVFHARGLGGAARDFSRAKKYFDDAAKHGNRDATEAINLLLPQKKKQQVVLPVIDEYEEFLFNNSNATSKYGAIENHKMMRIAVT